MCSCNKNSSGSRLPPRNVRQFSRGVDGVGMDARVPMNRYTNVAGQMPFKNSNPNQPQPINYDRIRIERLRRDAINQANLQKKQN